MSLSESIGFGTMSMTWVPAPQPTEKSVETLKYVVKKYGVKFINGGVFYGGEYANLKLLKAFVDSCKDDPEINAAGLTISIKGLVNGQTFAIDGSKSEVEKEIKVINEHLPPKGDSNRPKIWYEPARVDKSIPFNETLGYIYEFVKSGDIDGISISEVAATTIAAAADHVPISAIEVEVSFLSTDVFSNGVLAEASKRKIPIFAYSPLSRGLLTDKTVKEADTFLSNIDSNDFRLNFDRFQKDNYESNLVLIKKLAQFAKKKDISLEALTLSWLVSLKGKNLDGISDITSVIPIPSGSNIEKIDANYGSIISLSADELNELYELSKNFEVQGGRYNQHAEATLFQ